MSWKPLIVALILTPLLFIVAFLPCGVGHGNCTLFAVFFPLMIVPDLIGDVLNPMAWGCIQSLLYGIILGVAARRGHLWPAAICLLVLHVLAVVLVLRV